MICGAAGCCVHARRGFDLANETEYDKWFPLLSNPRALSVQSEWAGLAGELVAQSNESVTTIIPHGMQKRSLCFPVLMLKMTILPRQARDKPRENSKTGPFYQVHPARI
jgi:hypothetical protein